MSVAKGHTFGATEQVTNTKLHNLVDDATVSLEHDEIASNMFTSLACGSLGLIPYHMLVQSMASGDLMRYDGSSGFYSTAS